MSSPIVTPLFKNSGESVLFTWSGIWIFFVAALLGLTMSLCFVLTVCTCRSFLNMFTCEPLLEDEDDEEDEVVEEFNRVIVPCHQLVSSNKPSRRVLEQMC